SRCALRAGSLKVGLSYLHHALSGQRSSPPRPSSGTIRDQCELRATVERLDPRLLSTRGRAVDHRGLIYELDREPAGRVAAALARRVHAQSPRDVGAPAGVQAVVGAAQHVDPGLAHRLLYGVEESMPALSRLPAAG